MSIRAISRMTGVHKTTIQSLLYHVGEVCERLMQDNMRALNLRSVQADEIWCFVQKKQAHTKPYDEEQLGEMGDQWIYVAMDADSKLVPVYHIGKRTNEETLAFIGKLSACVNGRFQLSTDQYGAYNYAVKHLLGNRVDYGQVAKKYGDSYLPEGMRRYSPARCISASKVVIRGNPSIEDISTSYIERQNLTMRMQVRRLTRLTNAFSKSLRGLQSAIALHFAHYNLCRVHSSLGMTPAMSCGVTDKVWDVSDLLAYSN